MSVGTVLALALAAGAADEIQLQRTNLSETLMQATRLENDEMPDQAIVKFREASKQALELERIGGGWDSQANLRLARLLVKKNDRQGALDSYKTAFTYKEGVPITLPFVDGAQYAIELAWAGRAEDAKAVYYALQNQYRDHAPHREPLPHLVVFEADPGMTEWTYTPERLQAAALMLQAPFLEKDFLTDATYDVVRRANKLEPTWIVPYLHFWFEPSHRVASLKAAMNVASSGEEKSWVAAYQKLEGEFDGKASWPSHYELEAKLKAIGVERRAKSRALANARELLKGNWQRVFRAAPDVR